MYQAQLDATVELKCLLRCQRPAVDARVGLALTLRQKHKLAGKSVTAQITGNGIQALLRQVHIVLIAAALVGMAAQSDGNSPA
jgi:hypothetical protein